MSTWNRIFTETQRLTAQDRQNPPQPGQVNRLDRYRRGKIAAVEKITGRPLILYASACTISGKQAPSEMLMLDISDKIGFRAVTDDIDDPNLDILVHSPGGYPDATESIVQQLRGKYSNIRFIVPSFAKSAATMFVMSGDEILMDRDAELGPIDPQMRTQSGTSPAEAILEQFKKAQDELQKDSSRLPSWMPILSPLGPSLLVDSQHAIDLSKNLVRNWLTIYMFAAEPNADSKATAIADFLGDHSKFHSHGRAVKIPDLQGLGVKVSDIRDNRDLQGAIDELYCCLDILLGSSPVCKIFENSKGDALLRTLNVQQVPQLLFKQQPPPAPPRRR